MTAKNIGPKVALDSPVEAELAKSQIADEARERFCQVGWTGTALPISFTETSYRPGWSKCSYQQSDDSRFKIWTLSQHWEKPQSYRRLISRSLSRAATGEENYRCASNCPSNSIKDSGEVIEVGSPSFCGEGSANDQYEGISLLMNRSAPCWTAISTLSIDISAVMAQTRTLIPISRCSVGNDVKVGRKIYYIVERSIYSLGIESGSKSSWIWVRVDAFDEI